MESEPLDLPDRRAVLERLDTLITSARTATDPGNDDSAGGTGSHPVSSGLLGEPKAPVRPTLYLIGIAGYEALRRSEPDSIDAAMRLVVHRLDRLVRSDDVIGIAEPGTLLLTAASVGPESAGALIDRIAGAVALPVDIAGQPVSLAVHVGLGFYDDDATAQTMFDAATSDLERQRLRR